jgi:hypothetical protein
MPFLCWDTGYRWHGQQISGSINSQPAVDYLKAKPGTHSVMPGLTMPARLICDGRPATPHYISYGAYLDVRVGAGGYVNVGRPTTRHCIAHLRPSRQTLGSIKLCL